MLKKVLVGFCSTIMMISAISAVSFAADNDDMSLSSGISSMPNSEMRAVTIKSNNLDYTNGFTAYIGVTKGAVSTTEGYFMLSDLASQQKGLYNEVKTMMGSSKTYANPQQINILPVGHKDNPYEDYDLIKVIFAGDKGYQSADKTLAEFVVWTTDYSKDVELVLLDNTTYIEYSNSDGTSKEGGTHKRTTQTKYTLKANTSKVAQKNDTEKFNAVQTKDADTFEVGFGANLTLSDAQNTGSTEVLWTLKNSDNNKSASDTVTYTYDTEGISGNIKVGLIVNGIAEADKSNWANVTATAGIVE